MGMPLLQLYHTTILRENHVYLEVLKNINVTCIMDGCAGVEDCVSSKFCQEDKLLPASSIDISSSGNQTQKFFTRKLEECGICGD